MISQPFQHIIVGLNNAIVSEGERDEKVAQLAEYMKTRMRLSNEHQVRTVIETHRNT